MHRCVQLLRWIGIPEKKDPTAKVSAAGKASLRLALATRMKGSKVMSIYDAKICFVWSQVQLLPCETVTRERES